MAHAHSASCLQAQGTVLAGARLPRRPACNTRVQHAPGCVQAGAAQDPLLLRVARGEGGERTPVWLMRQAGRYMAAFREYSTKIPFRQRSETAEIAIELSLQPWRAFQPDGVIMFSDILTPLPSLGIEFDVVPGKGPVIQEPLRSMEAVRALRPMADPDASLPFIRPLLQALRAEVGNASTVLGFVGTPWTLAAYAVEGKADRHCTKTKTMMMRNPAVLHALLAHLADALVVYVCHQIDCGAQYVQLFDSWAHHLSPEQFGEFSLPYAQRVIAGVKERHPHVPLGFYGNGSTGKLHLLHEPACTADVVGVDWQSSMAAARAELPGRVLQGNVDPMILFGSEDSIRAAVERCCRQAGPGRHILNLGHGVVQQTPEENVGIFIDAARQSAAFFQDGTSAQQRELVNA